MAPRGLSAEEKRVKLVEIFHETKDFYQLKELEKLGPKLKGIVSQSVKEVLQSLVDDGLVQADKIGSSNFFWSFPSHRGAMMSNRLQTVKQTYSELQTQVKELHAAKAAENAARIDTVERSRALSELGAVRMELVTLEKEMSQYGSCDPAKLEAQRRATLLAREAAVRWTDNVEILLSHFTRQNGTDPREIRQYLGIGDDFEDLC